MPVWMKWTISLLVACGLIYLGWHVLPILVTLHVIVCIVLIIVIMLQSGSAADLAGAFGGAGSQTAFGPRGATTFLSRATTWCAIVFMMTSLALSIKRTPGEGTGSILENLSNPAPAKTPAPAPGKTVPPVTLPSQTPAPTSQVPAPAQAPTQSPAQTPAAPPKQ
jgi:preprotein translocase subunit SecG